MRHFLVLVPVVLFAACGSVEAPCGPANCAGCCSTSGECLGGTANDACGTAGLACSMCSAQQVCSSKRCEASSNTGGGAGGGSGSTGGGSGADAGNPFVAPSETWTWGAVEGSACGNGMPTGVGVNLTTRSQDVLVYLQGGGACWNNLTCFGFKTAQNMETGYTAGDFAAEATVNGGPFQRATMNNPFKDMSFVFVPYCTGDVHSGDKDSTYPAISGGGQTLPERTAHHRGARNMALVIDRLRHTFPRAQRIFISGSSAGAYGAQFNFPALKAAFPNAEVHVLADSGQMVNPSGTLLSEWVASWNMQAPAACVGCTTDFTKFPLWLHDTYPTSRFGLLAFTQDSVLLQFFGYSAADFQTQTLNLLTSAYDGKANARYFVVAGNSHTMLGSFFTQQGPGTVSLRDWTASFIAGDAAWTNQKP